MSLIYVTGVSGTGKSTLRYELLRRGYDAYDTDEDGFRAWYDRGTLKFVDSDLGYNEAPKAWHKKYQLRIKRERVEALVSKSKDKLVFLCGSTPNDKDIYDFVDKIIVLIVSEPTMRRRVATRTNNKFGKDPEEFAGVLERHGRAREDAERIGAVCVDAEQPIEKVAEDTIRIVEAK